MAIVLLNVVFSVWKIVRDLPDMLTDPDTSAVGFGAILALWVAWIAVELVAVRLVWRGRAAGRWILVASLGLKAMAQIALVAAWLPSLVRAPLSVLASPWLYYLIQALCYCVATIWLLFFARFDNQGTGQGDANASRVDDTSPDTVRP